MKKWWAVFGGLGLGAGLMYILDPIAARKRKRGAAPTDGGGLRGILAEAEDAFGATDDDEALAERVRARLRRSFPRTPVEVAVMNGVVRLSGPVSAEEFDRLVSAVLKIRGVQDVEDWMNVLPTGG